MNQSVHKITLQNRTQTMRFHPFVFTGKERDEETGYGYFGARYMDHELMTMWLSVDPMADKYPSISPYAYCAWNPVKLVDPDGMEALVNDDGWLINHENKTVIRISDNGGNQKQYTISPDGSSSSYDMNVDDFLKGCQADGYKIKESPSFLVGVSMAAGSTVSSIVNKSIFDLALDNLHGLQETSNTLGHGLDYSKDIGKVSKIESSLNITGKALGFLGMGFSIYQLMNDDNIEDAAFHFMDMVMGGVGTIPAGVTNGMSLGWSLFGRQAIKAQAESYKVLRDLGWNPGHISLAPFK